MTLVGRFIGVNKYLDRNIRDLNGAGRDAIALWALFSDTIPGMDAQLLINADANVTSIRQAFQETLEGAALDDTVILFFSGHGSPDHRLAAHDTSLVDLENTTIPMQELAELFKRSRAKAILCILDCCFPRDTQRDARFNEVAPNTVCCIRLIFHQISRVNTTTGSPDGCRW